MAEYLHMPDQVIRQRIASAMQGLLRAQEQQIAAFGAHYNALYTGEIAQFTRAYEQSYPITVSDDEVRRSFSRALDSLRETVNANMLELRERAAAQAEEAKVHCTGVNACKGQSACKTAQNECKGMNGCKGQGFLEMSKKECTAAQAKAKEEAKRS